MIQVNTLFIAFLTLYISQTVCAVVMERLNLRFMKKHGSGVPTSFEGFLDDAALARSNAYAAARSRLGTVQDIVGQSILLAVIVSGFLVGLEGQIQQWKLGNIAGGLLFLLVPALISAVAELPFDYHETFVIEQKYGFNRSTVGLWVTDHVKSAAIALVLFVVLVSPLIRIMDTAPDTWWFWGFLVVSAVQVLLVVLYPVFIAPLFNKFEPVRDELLAKKIKTLMEDHGVRVKKILQMNAEVRSRHTNAYFTGLGRTKQVVLYDTLLESHSHQEILAVLAHELGHLKCRHIPKQLLLFEASLLAALFASYQLINRPELYTTFGFESARPYVGLFLLGIVWQKAGFFLKPLYMAIARRYEQEADDFSLRFIGSPGPLLAALKRLAADNLSNLRPHPLYVWFHYSHPPLLERTARLEKAEAATNGPVSSEPHRLETGS